MVKLIEKSTINGDKCPQRSRIN